MKRFNNILCMVDIDSSSETAIWQARKLANDHQAMITFAAVLKTSGTWHSAFRNKKEVDENLQEVAKNKKAAVKDWIAKIAPDLNPTLEIYSGTEFIEIIKSVNKNGFDLVIKCAKDPDWLDRLFGSDDMHLLRKCPCPTLLLKPGQNKTFRSILATVDVNDDFNEFDKTRVQEQLNKKVLEYTAALGTSELTELHIGSAWEAFGEDFYRYGSFSQLPKEKADLYVEQVRRECSDKLKLLVREMNDELGKDVAEYLSPRTHLVKGDPSKEIPLMAEKYHADLIVMGTVGRIGIPGLLIGNTAELILEQVKCSILAIKPDGFETPVL